MLELFSKLIWKFYDQGYVTFIRVFKSSVKKTLFWRRSSRRSRNFTQGKPKYYEDVKEVAHKALNPEQKMMIDESLSFVRGQLASSGYNLQIIDDLICKIDETTEVDVDFSVDISPEEVFKKVCRKAGYFHSDETRQRIREALKGHTVSKESREKMRLSHLGKTHTVSPETGRKISETKRLNPYKHTEEAKEKIGLNSRLRPRSPEEKARRSQLMHNKWQNPEYKERMRKILQEGIDKRKQECKEQGKSYSVYSEEERTRRSKKLKELWKKAMDNEKGATVDPTEAHPSYNPPGQGQ